MDVKSALSGDISSLLNGTYGNTHTYTLNEIVNFGILTKLELFLAGYPVFEQVGDDIDGDTMNDNSG